MNRSTHKQYKTIKANPRAHGQLQEFAHDLRSNISEIVSLGTELIQKATPRQRIHGLRAVRERDLHINARDSSAA